MFGLQKPSFASGCVAAVAAAAAAVTTGIAAPRKGIGTVQGSSSSSSSGLHAGVGRWNGTSSVVPDIISATSQAPDAAVSTAVAGTESPRVRDRSPEIEPTSSNSQRSAPLASASSLPLRRSRDADAGPLEDGGDVPGILTSLSMGVLPAGIHALVLVCCIMNSVFTSPSRYIGVFCLWSVRLC